MSNDRRKDPGSQRNRMALDDGTGNAPLDLAHWVSVFFRTSGQILGAVLLLIGVYYSLGILFNILEATRDPQKLEAAMQRMTALLDLTDAKLVLNDETIPLGKTVGFGALVVWYLLSLWIPLALITGGTKLIWGPISERKAFYNALEEFFRNARNTNFKQKP